MPFTAATVLHATLGGSAPFSHGSTRAAATSTYRIAPISSVFATHSVRLRLVQESLDHDPRDNVRD
ncbi:MULTISPECIES: hypothetical protein [Streptomyces]|uniref:hypothetical protein n=1 Tax=Streptomyces TaxID=1883 RepID=UPI003375270D